MGRDPRSFEDRVLLGDEARLAGDWTGALIEYQSALRITPDFFTSLKLGEISKQMNDHGSTPKSAKNGS